MKELVHEGLMRREPRRRACVPRLNAEDIRDLYFVRSPLEIRAVEAITGNLTVLDAAVQAVEHFERLGAGSPRGGMWWTRICDFTRR